MKRIIIFAASLLALTALSSCRKLEPTEITANEYVNHVELTIKVVYAETQTDTGNSVPAGTTIDILTNSGIHIQRQTGGQYGNQIDVKFGCDASGETITAKATWKGSATYYTGSASKTLNADSAGLLELKLVKITK